MYTMRFWFEHGGGCLWSTNNAARETYGYAVKYSSLPIDNELKTALASLEATYHTYLDWDDPAAGCQWTDEEKATFLCAANAAYHCLCAQLGEVYQVEKALCDCV